MDTLKMETPKQRLKLKHRSKIRFTGLQQLPKKPPLLDAASTVKNTAQLPNAAQHMATYEQTTVLELRQFLWEGVPMT